MAVVTRYVNTASTAGGDGTTNGTSGATRAYATISEWESNEQTDLVTDTDTHIVNCSGSTADTTAVIITGWTTGASNFITVNGENNALGAYDTSAYRIEFTTTGSNQRAYREQESYTITNDLQVQTTSTNSNARGIQADLNGGEVNRCIAKGVLSGTATGSIGIYIQSTSAIPIARACLFYDWDLSSCVGILSESSVSGGLMESCTAYNCTTGHRSSQWKKTKLRDCLSQNCTTDWSGTSTGSDYNGDEDGTMPGANSQTGTATFVDAANDDFQPASGDTVAKDNGTDLSGTFDFDLANNAMPTTWPIGCLQAAVAAGGANPKGVFGMPFQGPFAGPIG